MSAGERPKGADNLCDIFLLKKPNGGDPGSPRVEAGAGILQSDSAEREHRDICAAGLFKLGETRRLCSWSVFLLEDGSEDG